MVRGVARTTGFVRVGQYVVVGAIGAGLLSMVTGLSAFASSAVSPERKQQSSQAELNDRLPSDVARRVRRDLARRTDIPQRQLRVVSYSQQSWSDSCLGLGTAAEICAQALVPGWQVELTDGEQRWVYRTDATGQTMRLQEPSNASVSLPEAVSDRILEAAAADSGISESELTLVEARQQTWDGCLGIVSADGVCTKIAIPGWQVIVSGGGGSWVYHSDADGSDIRLNETASLPDSAVALGFIAAEQLPSNPETGVVFKASVEGGITGSSSQILLLEDGQIVQFADDQGVSTATELNRLSPEQVQAFTEVLQQQLFQNLNGLSYAAPSGAADYRTVTLIGQSSTAQYADIVQDQLPAALQQVIQAWDEMVSENASS